MFDKSAIEKIEQMAGCRVHEIHGRQYAERGLVLIPKEPRPLPLKLNTLTGLADYLKANVDKLKFPELVLHVASPLRVLLHSQLSGDDAGRSTLIEVVLELPSFAVGRWMDQETFLINLQTQFVPTESLSRLQAFVGRMKSEQVMNQDDDGVTQTVRLRKGIAMTESGSFPNPIALQPYRTFREVEQPESLFVLRLKDAKEGQPPVCALFEADGSAWSLRAIGLIRDWLRERVPEVAIIA